MDKIQSHAKLVVVGGGIMGVSLLYHLTKEGWSDVVLIEKSELTSGSTWHAAGQCPHMLGSLNLAKIHLHSTNLYKSLEKETGQPTGFHETGSLRLAYKKEDLQWFHYVKGILDIAGSPCSIISTDEIHKYHPFIKLDGILGAFYTPEDGYTDPTSTTNAMAKGARDNGAKIYRKNRVTDIEHLPSGEWKVITEKGNITCEHIVNAAGSFCPEVSQMVGIKNVPSINMVHQYLVTESHPEIEKLDKELPVVRDPDSSSYLRQEGKGLLIGPYEQDVAAWALDGMDWKFDMELLEPDLDRIEKHLEKGMDRIPQFKDVGIKRIICGPITHTPDDNFLAGPAPGLKNFWMFCAASIGIAHGGGAGKYMAQWIVHGDSEINMMEFEPRRYLNWVNKEYSVEKSKEQYRRMYVTPMPHEKVEAGRPMKTSGVYQKLKDKSAEYYDLYGWEKPDWFNTDKIKEELSYNRNNIFPYIQKECEHVHNNVGVLDLSTFSKYEITGKDSYQFLDRLCVNRIPKKDGSIILTHTLNSIGRIQSEFIITKVKENHYYALSAAVSEIRDLDWFNQNKQDNEKVTIKNVSLEKGVLGLIGPKSRNVLSKITNTDSSNENFPWLKSREIKINDTEVLALRVNYAGELGWELHIPMNKMSEVYDLLFKEGQSENIIDFGSRALNSMRMEKGYRGWGSELTPEISVVEASLDKFFNLDKKDNFNGSDAVKERLKKGIDTKLVYLEVDAKDADAHGNEPVYYNNERVGLTTSGGYGFRVKKSLAFAYVKPDTAKLGNEFTVDIQGNKIKATIIKEPAFDPENLRLKS
jgi:dimethylglycine dehydrogenase